jgi:TRAP-type transport system periplasmic protein
MKKIRCFGFMMAALLLLFLAIPGPAASQQTIELSYGSPFGPDHTFSQSDRAWMAKIEKETNGRVKFKPFWGGTIIGSRDGIDELAKGVADVAYISPGYSKTGFHIAKGSFLFFTGATQENGRQVWLELLKKFPEIEAEYKGLKVLCWASGTDYVLVTSKKAVRKMADMKGMRLKSNGEILSVLKELGVEGTVTPPPELYQSIQKGVLDGAFTPPEGLRSLRLAEVTKYITMTNIYRVHQGQRAMNLGTYNKLPADIKKIVDNSIEWFGQEQDANVQKGDKEGLEFAKSKGVEIIVPAKEEMAKFYGAMRTEAIKEAKELDGKGLPGTKVYQEAQALIQKYSK